MYKNIGVEKRRKLHYMLKRKTEEIRDLYRIGNVRVELKEKAKGML